MRELILALALVTLAAANSYTQKIDCTISTDGCADADGEQNPSGTQRPPSFNIVSLQYLCSSCSSILNPAGSSLTADRGLLTN